MSAKLVDNTDSVRALVESLEDAAPKPIMFVDLEGVHLSRHGSIAIMQILIPPNPTVHLVDVHILKQDAFETRGREGSSLRSILESEEYPKVFFDVRRDSDALFSHFEVNLRCVIDLQLLEFATRPRQGKFLKGLGKCIEEDAQLDISSRKKCQRIKDAGLRMFAPEKGGNYEVFLERPLSDALVDYCAQDVSLLPKLLSIYGQRLRPHLAVLVHEEALRRIVLSQSPSFNVKGCNMAQGPVFPYIGHGLSRAPCFPISIVCSKDLMKFCNLDEPTLQAPTEKPTSPLSHRESIGVASKTAGSIELLSEGVQVARIDDVSSRRSNPLAKHYGGTKTSVFHGEDDDDDLLC